MAIIKQLMSKNILKRVASISLLSILFLGLFYVLLSPSLISLSKQGTLFSFLPFSIAKANTIYQTVTLSVGKEATVSAPGPLNLSGSIGGVSGGIASGTASFGVLSSSNVGFTMSVAGGQTNALAGTSGYSFFDYAPATGGVPDFNWVAPIAGSSAFGYAVTADTLAAANQKFRFTGGTPCNISAGTSNSDQQCWYGFSTGAQNVVTRSTGFYSGLATETLNFQAQYHSSPTYAIPEGTYTATITVTVSAS